MATADQSHDEPDPQGEVVVVAATDIVQLDVRAAAGDLLVIVGEVDRVAVADDDSAPDPLPPR